MPDAKTTSHFEHESTDKVCQRLAPVIIRQLNGDPAYGERWFRSFRPEYFREPDKTAFTVIARHMDQYGKPPTAEQLAVTLDDERGQHAADAAKRIKEYCGDPYVDPSQREWLDGKTKNFIQNQHDHTLILRLIDAKENNLPLSPDMFERPLATDMSGLDSYSADFLQTLAMTNNQQGAVIPFDLEVLNRSLGGVRKKTLNVILGGTGVGKSLLLCHFAAAYLRRGLDVLYVSMEMDRTIIMNRVMANLLDCKVANLLQQLQLPGVIAEYERLKANGLGRLIAHDWPTGTAHCGDFRAYLNQLKRAWKFTPTVIIIDYLNICASERVVATKGTPQYVVFGSIAKELRALGQMTDTVVWTATQATRQGLKGKVELANISDSVQIGFDADVVLAIWREGDRTDQLHVSVEKHRNGAANQRGILGLIPEKMKVCDLAEAVSNHMKDNLQRAQVSKDARRKKVPPASLDVEFDIDQQPVGASASS